MFVIKTIIELFDVCQIENVVACLRFCPEKVVFVGFKETMKYQKREALKRFFALRKLDISIEFEIVPRYDFDAIVQKLSDIIDRNEDCCFDLTGGKELVLAAMGHISAQKDIPMLQFNVRTGNLVRVKNCEAIEENAKSTMRIDESIVLNGGTVIYNDKNDFAWQLTEDFKHDIEIMWSICRRDCALWNRQCSMIDKFVVFGNLDENYLLSVNPEYLRQRNIRTEADSNMVIKELIRHKLLSEYRQERDYLSFRFKNEQVCRAICKAGNILELYTYMIANEISKEEPGFYDDIDVGVIVDWDSDADEIKTDITTRNEIDVMLMRDLVPVFISCKNGEVHKEALYELETVAERFGGEYARKILLTTYISHDPLSRKYLLKRASEMGISVVDSVDEMNREEFINEFKKCVR